MTDRYNPCVGNRADRTFEPVPWRCARGGRIVADFLVYGLNEAGQPVHTEMLRGCEREALRALARERLDQWHAVEIWEGPICLVRLSRAPSPQD